MSRVDAIVALGVFGAALFVGALTVNHGLALGDDGNLILAAQRVLAGQVPFVDFRHYFYSPGRIYTLAGLFNLFGDTYLVSRWMWVVVRALSATLVFLIAARELPRTTALLPTLVVVLIPGPWFKSLYALCGLLPLYLALLYHTRPSPLRLALLGAGTAFALIFRQDMGISAMAMGVVVVVHSNLFDSERAPRRVLGHLGMYFATVGALLAPGLLYLCGHGALGPMLQQLFVDTPAFTTSQVLFTVPRLRDLFSANLMVFILLVGPALTVAGGVVALFRLPLMPRKRFFLFLICAMAAASLAPGYLAFTPIRIFQSYHIAWILYAFLAHHLVELGLRNHRFIASLHRHLRVIAKRSLSALVPICFVGCFYCTSARALDPFSTPTLLDMPFQLQMRGEDIRVSWKDGAWISHLVRFVHERTADNEPIVFLPTYSLLNYICDRPNHTSYINLWTHLYADSEHGLAVERHLLEELRATSVRFIFTVESKKLREDLSGYLQTEYQELFPIGPLIVLQRKDTLQQ